jgi:creatinine amidohydrolase
MLSAIDHPSPFAYHARYLPAMTLAQIAALPNKGHTPVILTTGAIEQHGPHLPVAVDALMGQVWLARIFAALPADVPAFVAPPITVGKSNEHVGFPGTVFVAKETLRRQLLAVAHQLHAWGFRSLLVLNTHGGNTSVLAYVLREIEHVVGLRAGLLRSGITPDGLSDQENAYGFHAGRLESAWLYAIAPELCRPESATCSYPAYLSDPGELRPECSPATFAWASQDVSPDGVMGDARAATAEDGERWLKQITAGYVAALSDHVQSLRSK